MTGYAFCNPATLSQSLATIHLPALASEDVVLGAAREAWQLAQRAYEGSSPADTAIAERLLYLIHRSSGFAPPVGVVASMVWAPLVEAKLAKLIPPQTAAALDSEQMVAKLEHGVLAGGTHRHPLVDDLLAEGTLRGYRVFLKNWYAMASGFTEFLISVAQRATAAAMRGGIIENLSDELFDETPHIDLRARVLEGAGTRFDPLVASDDPEIATETLALINWRAAASTLPNPSFALGLFYSIEANWQIECKRHLSALRALGVADEYLTSLVIHVERDEDHASEWLAMIRKTVTVPGDRADVVRGLSVELAVRRRMYDALRRQLYAR